MHYRTASHLSRGKSAISSGLPAACLYPADLLRALVLLQPAHALMQAMLRFVLPALNVSEPNGLQPINHDLEYASPAPWAVRLDKSRAEDAVGSIASGSLSAYSHPAAFFHAQQLPAGIIQTTMRTGDRLMRRKASAELPFRAGSPYSTHRNCNKIYR